jgi:hypothetical protein
MNIDIKKLEESQVLRKIVFDIDNSSSVVPFDTIVNNIVWDGDSNGVSNGDSNGVSNSDKHSDTNKIDKYFMDSERDNT